MRQLIAGSGDLAVPTHGLTQRVLKWCYETPREAMGWAERDGLGVAFRRTPTGQDSGGREGAYFVHALVWRSGTLPAALLPGLRDSALWVARPPDTPLPQLHALRDVAALKLSDVAPLERATAVDLLAAYLANIEAGRPSALAADPAEAYRWAAALAGALPAHFELPSFSTYEAAHRAKDYDILAKPAPVPPFATISAGGVGDRLWRGAATLLLDAAAGDTSAAQAIDAVGEGAATLRAFATALRWWAVLDLVDPAGSPPASQHVADAAVDHRLLNRLLSGPRATNVARAVADGLRAAEVFDAADRIDRRRELIGALRLELTARRADAAIDALLRLQTAAGHDAGLIAEDVAAALERRHALEELDPQRAVALLGMLAGAPVKPVVEALIRPPANAAAIVADGRVPAQWRGMAAAAAPAALPARALLDSLTTDRHFADGFLGMPGALGALPEIFAAAPATLGYDALQAVDRDLTEEQRAELALPVLLRLPTLHRLGALTRYAPVGPAAATWSDAALDALVALVLDGRFTRSPLPGVVGWRLPRADTARAVGWENLLGDLHAARGRGAAALVTRAAREAVVLERPDDADAALEVVVDRSADLLGGDPEGWAAVTAAARRGDREPTLGFATRLARAAVRSGEHDRRSTARWTLAWIAGALDLDTLTRDEVDGPPFDRLTDHLRELDLDALGRVIDTWPRGQGKKWLKAHHKTLKRRYAEHP
jgi:hypothetical protein